MLLKTFPIKITVEMNLSNVPGRAFRKLQNDGVQELFYEGRDVLLTDFLFYRTVYRYLLQDRVDVLTRDGARNSSEAIIFDEYDEPMRLKQGSGFRGRNDPDQYNPGNRFVCEFPDATLIGPSGPGVTAEGAVVADTVGTPPLTPRRTGVTIAQSMTENGVRRTLDALGGDIEPDRRLGTVALAVPPWNNYYHWTVECLLRVRLLEKYGSKTGTYPTLLVPSDCSGWMEESLELIDYSGDVVSFDGGIARVDSLVVPTFPDPIPEECFWIRDRMLTGSGPDSAQSESERSERIYIARGDATVRRISNRDAVQRVLDEHDVDTYLLSQLSVAEQVALFNHADLVVAPHGAGLTNILYGDDLTVVELFGDKTVATFDRLAENIGHEYRYVQCQQDGVDIRIDTNALDEVLQNAVGS